MSSSLIEKNTELRFTMGRKNTKTEQCRIGDTDDLTSERGKTCGLNTKELIKHR